MTVSPITLAVQEGHVTSLALFLRNSVQHLLWTSPTRSESVRQLYWRPHDSGEAPVEANYQGPFGELAPLVRVDGNLLVIFDDLVSSEPASARVWWTVFNSLSGEALLAPEPLCEGSRPSLTRQGTSIVLVYRVQRTGQVYVRESRDEGANWSAPRPVLNNAVAATAQLAVVPFGTRHVALAQVGDDARRLREVGAVDFTRPLAALEWHADGRLLAVEASQRQVAGVPQLADTLRGAVAITPSGAIVSVSRQRVGTGLEGDLMELDVQGTTPTVLRSTNLSGSSSGSALVIVRDGAVLSEWPVLSEDTPGAFVRLAVTDTHAYLARYSSASSAGGLVVVRLADGAVAAYYQQGHRVRAVAVAQVEGFTVVATALTDNIGQERLHIFVHEPAGLAMVASARLYAPVENLLLALAGPDSGQVYVCAQTGIDLYTITGWGLPFTRTATWRAPGNNLFYSVRRATNRNLVAALGAGGVAVFSVEGKLLAQRKLSGVVVAPWRPNTQYGVNALAQPTEGAPYAPQGRFFRCTSTSGTSGASEPAWGPTGTIQDGAVTWVEAGPIATQVVDVAVDEGRRRIYAVGRLGGSAGTEARIYTMDAPTLL